LNSQRSPVLLEPDARSQASGVKSPRSVDQLERLVALAAVEQELRELDARVAARRLEL